MKTQISNLRSGTKNQILNPEIDYSKLPKATSHIGHGGTNREISSEVWKAVKAENPEGMRILFLGQEYDLKANWSSSGKSVTYYTDIPNDVFEARTGLKVGKGCNASISIQTSTDIILHNGKKYYCQVCPSLIEIL